VPTAVPRHGAAHRGESCQKSARGRPLQRTTRGGDGCWGLRVGLLCQAKKISCVLPPVRVLSPGRRFGSRRSRRPTNEGFTPSRPACHCRPARCASCCGVSSRPRACSLASAASAAAALQHQSASGSWCQRSVQSVGRLFGLVAHLQSPPVARGSFSGGWSLGRSRAIGGVAHTAGSLFSTTQADLEGIQPEVAARLEELLVEVGACPARAWHTRAACIDPPPSACMPVLRRWAARPRTRRRTEGRRAPRAAARAAAGRARRQATPRAAGAACAAVRRAARPEAAASRGRAAAIASAVARLG